MIKWIFVVIETLISYTQFDIEYQPKMLLHIILTISSLLSCEGTGLLKFAIPTIGTEGIGIGSGSFILETIYPNGGLGNQEQIIVLKAQIDLQ